MYNIENPKISVVYALGSFHLDCTHFKDAAIVLQFLLFSALKYKTDLGESVFIAPLTKP